MEGLLPQVNVGSGGVPKHATPAATVTRLGLEGDVQADRRYHGGSDQALCLFDADTLQVLAREGYPVGPGSLGENFTTRGLDYRAVRLGDVYHVGAEGLIQITKPRVPCRTIQAYGAGLIKRLWGPTVPWGESGFYARVLSGGRVCAGDAIRLVRPGVHAPPAVTRKLTLVE